MHQLRLMQLSIGYQQEAQAELDRTERRVGDVAASLAAFVSATGGLRTDDPRAIGHLERSRRKVFEARQEGFRACFSRLGTRLEEIRSYECLFYRALLRAGGREPGTPGVATGAAEIMGKDLDAWRRRLFANDAHRLNEGLSLGARLGDSETALRARLVGHGSYGGRDGLTAVARRELDALVRTATVAFASLARINIGSSGKEIYIAILDSHTTDQCTGLHGTVYGPNDGPRPPVHWGCRSVRVPLVGEGPNRIPSYREWLSRLSVQNQNEVLGSRRAKSFRTGRLPDLQNFREPNWRGIDLGTLAHRERQVFGIAGMETPFQ